MDTDSIFDRLDRVLEEERDAIRRLDGVSVEAIANEKMDLVQQLSKISPEARIAAAKRLQHLVAELRRNNVLLVHARGVLGDILRLRGAEVTASTQKPFARTPDATPNPRFSMRG